MKKLTLEYALANNFTPIDLVKYFKPNWDNNKCDTFLWEKTAFPCCNIETTINQLNKYFIKIV